MTQIDPELLAWLDRLAEGDLRGAPPHGTASGQSSGIGEAEHGIDRLVADRLRALQRRWAQERVDIAQQTLIRMQEESAAFEREARIFAVHSDAIVILNSAGEIARANQAFVALVGRSLADLTGQHVARVLDSELVAGQLIEALRSETIVHDVVATMVRADNTRVEVSISGSAVNSGAQIEMVLVARDLSETHRRLAAEAAVVAEREKAEELRSLLEQLERANKELAASQQRLLHADRLAAIGQMAAGVAHEINNPATFVLTNLELLQEDLATIAALTRSPSLVPRDKLGKILTEAAEMLSHSTEGMQRIRSITRDLSTFSRIEQEKLEEVDVPELLRLALRMVSNQLKARCRVHTDLEPVPPIMGDRGKLAQVLINLLVNAAQSLDDARFDTNRIELSCRSIGDIIRIEVRDTGGGIPQTLLHRIFEPFFTTKPRDAGTGLGLSLSAEIIRAHDGSIDVDSCVGVGTTFTIDLPARATELQRRTS